MMGKPCHGPGIMQIWGIGHQSSATATCSDPANAPATMALGICHDGGVVWDLKWWPGRQQEQREHMRSTASRLPGWPPDPPCKEMIL